jgi:hypothetical protein
MYVTHSYQQQHHHYAEPATVVESLLETTSIKLTEGTKYALSVITFSDLVDNYISPIIRYFHALYQQQPEWLVVRLGMIGVMVGGMVPVGCLMAGVGLVSMGCFVVGGSALLLIEVCSKPRRYFFLNKK